MILTCLGVIVAVAVLSPLIARVARPLLGPLSALTLFGVAIAFALTTGDVFDGRVITPLTPWVPELGVNLAWRVDGLSLTFTLLISVIGGFVMLYAGSYMRTSEEIGRFFCTLLSFAAAMLGLVLADNVLMVFVFWELTSITSYMLIGFEHRKSGARWAATQSLMITGIGGMALLGGLILLGLAAGGGGTPVFELGPILAAGEAMRAHWAFTPGVVLVLLGCFSKSAIFPLHMWLPNAMAAPSPVSALLHSSTMVKAGVYLAMRLNPGLQGSALWEGALIVFGGFTMAYAAVLATRQVELKKILAYSTVSSLGLLTMLVGLNAGIAAAAYLVAHALFKACLFLIAGSVAHETHEKNPFKMGGLRTVMPVTAAIALIGGLSLAGVPPMLGFVGKELLIKAGTHAHEWAVFVMPAIVITAAAGVYAAYMVAWRPFHGPKPDGLHGHEPPPAELAGPAVLAALSLLVGVAPGLLSARGLIEQTALSIDPGAKLDGVYLSAISMLTHLSVPLVVSVAALAAGYTLWHLRGRYDGLVAWLPLPRSLTADRAYDAAMSGMMSTAEWQTRVLQNGSLRSYTRTTLVGALLLIIPAAVIYASGASADVGRFFAESASRTSPIDWMLGLLIGAAAVVAVFQRKMLSAVVVLGTVGFVGAAVFLLYGAPDVAMTQLSVETLVVIIFVLVIYHMPRFSRLTGPSGRAVDAVIAAGLGLTMGLLTLVAARFDLGGVFPPISQYHAENAVPKAYGHNIINVILVDFRAFDTLGEIFVLGAAAVGLFTLLRPPSRRLVVQPKGDRRLAAGPEGVKP